MKKILKKIGLGLLFLLIMIGIYCVTAFTLSRIGVNKNIHEPEDIIIYLITNGMHSDLMFPIKSEEIDWSKEIKFSKTKSKDSIQKYIAIGWGDKGFFLDVPDWDHVKFSIAFKAASGLNTTAMHTTYMNNIIEDENCKKIMISKEQYKTLITYILNSFQRDENGNIINIKTDKVYGNNDSFYEAKGSYSIFFTCNSWTNKTLKQAKLKACVWTPFQEGIFRQYR